MSKQTAIVLVEDNPDDVELLQRAFRQARITNPMEVIGDGESAIDRLAVRASARGEEPALVLLDLRLPRRSGFEVLKRLREHPRSRFWPVVVLTSSGESSDVRRAYELGANSYLVKPVGSSALLEMVKTLDRYWTGLNVRAD